MLTNPVDFPKLTMNGLPKAKQMSFLNFVHQRGFPINREGPPSSSSSSSSTDDDTPAVIENAIQQALQNVSIVGSSPFSSTDDTNHSNHHNHNHHNRNENGEGAGNILAEEGGLSMEEKIAQTMHRAYNDMILHQMQQQHHEENDASSDLTATTTTNTTNATNATTATKPITNFQPLKSMLLEIHTLLRSLIPNRKDLHSILDDEELMTNTTFDTSFEHTCHYLLKVCDAVSMLESEYRAETTKQWRDEILRPILRKINNDDDNDPRMITIQMYNSQEQQEQQQQQQQQQQPQFKMSKAAFTLASTTYLHYKTELCQSETADFQLAHILAPKIYTLGSKYLCQIFLQKFGFDIGRNDDVPSSSTLMSLGGSSDDWMERIPNLDGDTLHGKLPNTKLWIEEMINNSTTSTICTKEELVSCQEKRVQVIKQIGWIDNILFRSPRNIQSNENEIGGSDSSTTDTTTSNIQSSSTSPSSPPTSSSSNPFLMPEVLWLDMKSIRDIRVTTKMAVVGSVLALHAITAAKVSDVIIKQDPLDDHIDECRLKLANAMMGGGSRSNDSRRSGGGGIDVGSQEEYENGICDVVLDLAKGSFVVLSMSYS